MELTRRELIAAFLGSAVAASACKRARPREPVPGAIVDRAVDVGHRLRGGPLPRAETVEPVEVLIIGAGAAGLSAAWRLMGAGLKDVRVVELDEVRKAVLVNMTFQLGIKGLTEFRRAMGYMERGEYTAASLAFADSRVAREQTPERWRRHCLQIKTGAWQ